MSIGETRSSDSCPRSRFSKPVASTLVSLSSSTVKLCAEVLIAIGIIGATVMPHSLFLGSALATQDRVSEPEKLKELPVVSVVKQQSRIEHFRTSVITLLTIKPLQENEKVRPQRHQDMENNTLAFVKAHIYHGIVDLVISLLGFAVVINALSVVLLRPSLPTKGTLGY